MNILICDANKSDTDNLTNILDYSHCSDVKITVFHRASDALSYVRSGAVVDGCFLETVTPEMDGIELARNLRAEGYTGGIIFLSKSKGYGTEAYEVNALHYITKPMILEDVRNALSRLEDITDTASIWVMVAPEATPIRGDSHFKRIKGRAGCFVKRLYNALVSG